ncbi:MAG: hypothetical protein HC831_11805 [Chloroflexia bacterium]|nr:hypothetical protein [Chloroflexia bacterium]
MKAILEFNLPEESNEHLAAIRGSSLASILFEINTNIRRKYLKYASLSEKEYEIAEKIFDDIANEIDINIDELT